MLYVPWNLRYALIKKNNRNLRGVEKAIYESSDIPRCLRQELENEVYSLLKIGEKIEK
jgi:hypothetical protein